MFLQLALLISFLSDGVVGDVQLNNDQCLQENGVVTLTCTVNPLASAVEWRIDSVLTATCSNLADNYCLYPGETTDPRYTFSSVIANGQFTFKIDPVSINTDVGDYKCIHGIESKTVVLAICASGDPDQGPDFGGYR